MVFTRRFYSRLLVLVVTALLLAFFPTLYWLRSYEKSVGARAGVSENTDESLITAWYVGEMEIGGEVHSVEIFQFDTPNIYVYVGLLMSAKYDDNTATWSNITSRSRSPVSEEDQALAVTELEKARKEIRDDKYLQEMYRPKKNSQFGKIAKK